MGRDRVPAIAGVKLAGDTPATGDASWPRVACPIIVAANIPIPFATHPLMTILLLNRDRDTSRSSYAPKIKGSFSDTTRDPSDPTRIGELSALPTAARFLCASKIRQAQAANRRDLRAELSQFADVVDCRQGGDYGGTVRNSGPSA
jgi:hypothetical protein